MRPPGVVRAGRAVLIVAGALRRSTYADAVATYDRGMQAFHQRRFAEAQEILGSILTQYPEEKELHERIQMYLNVCARQAAPRETPPQTLEERLNAATLALNDGRPDDAIVILENIYRFIEEKGMPPMRAAVEATRDIGLAVTATTFAPRNRMRATLSACRSMSTEPM